MLTLINANRMTPPIAPVGLDYVAAAAREAGVEVEVVDLALAEDADSALHSYFASARPALVGVSFRNVDDSFWPSGQWFVPELRSLVESLRPLTDAPIVLGGVGFSILADRVLDFAGADYGIRGDGERAVVELYRQLPTGRLDRVPGLIRRLGGRLVANPPAWQSPLSVPAARDAVDNAEYFRLGGQVGLETKRGCPRRCLYCADPLAKGPAVRARPPAEVADEAEALLARGVDVLHLCDGEFNVPRDHAMAVCEEFVRRGLGRRLRWYTYAIISPFDTELAGRMARAGCVGIDFTCDAAGEAMLAAYGHRHRPADIATAARACRDNGIAVMFDLLLGGPDETPETVAETIRFMQGLDADAVGAALGLRIYPGTPAAARIAAEGPMEANPAIRRRYAGPVDLLAPTFYISAALGDAPAALVRDLIGGDQRFFPPSADIDDPAAAPTDHNYNDNAELTRAIAAGARGAYWDILRRVR
jgi:radical SAM superfamily enzyme YgiQ (UPF0313 family)